MYYINYQKSTPDLVEFELNNYTFIDGASSRTAFSTDNLRKR